MDVKYTPPVHEDCDWCGGVSGKTAAFYKVHRLGGKFVYYRMLCRKCIDRVSHPIYDGSSGKIVPHYDTFEYLGPRSTFLYMQR